MTNKNEDPLLGLLYDNLRETFASGVDDRVAKGVDFVQHRYDGRNQMGDCLVFLHMDLFDAPKSSLDAISRVWMFPWREAHSELQEALGHSVMAHYKAAFDNIRRALELSIVGIYFLQDHVDEKSGQEWIKAKRETPLFSRAVAEICKSAKFDAASRSARWDSLIKEYYWELSDIVHVRGTAGSFDSVQPTSHSVNGIGRRSFSDDALSRVLDAWSVCVRHIATALALENPILMVGLDLFPKFGFNPPMSGFFEENQASRLRRLVLPEILPVLERIVQEDEEVESVVAWVTSRPDLTEEELEKQWGEHEKMMQSFRGNREWLKGIQS